MCITHAPLYSEDSAPSWPSAGFPGGSAGEESACKQETGFDPWVGKIPLEKGIATHSSILAWRIPWTQETGLPSMGCTMWLGRDTNKGKIIKAGGREWGEWGVRVSWVQSISLGRWKVLEVDGADGCTTMWMYLVPLDYRLKNSYGQFYVMYILSQFLFFF